jgi:3D (Asp-Asp-Asp) domain-containing protein
MTTATDRRTPRRQVSIAGEWQITGLRGDAEILDVSTGGVFVRIIPLDPSVVPPGTRLRVRFSLPDPDRTLVEAWGTVRWCGLNRTSHREGFGVAFDIPHIDLGDFALIA